MSTYEQGWNLGLAPEAAQVLWVRLDVGDEGEGVMEVKGVARWRSEGDAFPTTELVLVAKGPEKGWRIRTLPGSAEPHRPSQTSQTASQTSSALRAPPPLASLQEEDGRVEEWIITRDGEHLRVRAGETVGIAARSGETWGAGNLAIGGKIYSWVRTSSTAFGCSTTAIPRSCGIVRRGRTATGSAA